MIWRCLYNKCATKTNKFWLKMYALVGGQMVDERLFLC